MLLIAGRDINFNGQSIINEITIANFYGNYNKYDEIINNVNFNFNITDIKAYLENEENVKADFEEFKNTIIEQVKSEDGRLNGSIIEEEPVASTDETEPVEENE